MKTMSKILTLAAVLFTLGACSWLGLNKSDAPGKEKNPLVVPPVYNVRPVAEVASGQDQSLAQAINREIEQLSDAQ